MKDTTKKGLIVFGVVAAIGIGIGIFLYQRKKKRESTESYTPVEEIASEEDEVIAPLPKKPVSGGGAPGTIPSQPKPQQTGVPAQLNSVQKIKLFQDWMDKFYPTWVNGGKLNKGSGYGSYGPATKKAWGLYSKTYNNYLISGMSANYVAPPAIPQMSNLNLVKDRLKTYASNITKAAEGLYYVDVYLNNYSLLFRFYSNNRFAFYNVVNGGTSEICGGTYKDAGRILVIDRGLKAGQTISTANFWDSMTQLKA